MKKKKDKLKNAGAFFLTLFNRTPAASGLTQMKKLWEVIKKIFIWLGAVFVAIFTVLFIKNVRWFRQAQPPKEIQMKSIKKLRLSVMKRLLVLSVLMLGLLQNLTAQSAMQLQTEKKDSDNAAAELTIEEVMQIAEEEIERTAQEAVKAALLETGGELAFEKERADQFEKQKLALEIENKKLKEAAEKKKNQFFYGALIGGSGAVIITSLVYGFIASVR